MRSTKMLACLSSAGKTSSPDSKVTQKHRSTGDGATMFVPLPSSSFLSVPRVHTDKKICFARRRAAVTMCSERKAVRSQAEFDDDPDDFQLDDSILPKKMLDDYHEKVDLSDQSAGWDIAQGNSKTAVSSKQAIPYAKDEPPRASFKKETPDHLAADQEEPISDYVEKLSSDNLPSSFEDEGASGQGAKSLLRSKNRPKTPENDENDQSPKDDKSEPSKAEKDEVEKSKPSTPIKLSPEQMEKAKEARSAATKAANDAAAQDTERRKAMLDRAENILVKVGTRSKVFALGESAREKVEGFAKEAISAGEEKDASQQTKVKSSAVNALRSVSETFGKTWSENVAPKIRDGLPSGYKEVSSDALASTVLGLFVAVALLPSLFSGLGGPPKETAKNDIDSQTATLEKKMEQRKGRISSSDRSSEARKAVFPPESEVGKQAKQLPDKATSPRSEQSSSKSLVEKPSVTRPSSDIPATSSLSSRDSLPSKSQPPDTPSMSETGRSPALPTQPKEVEQEKKLTKAKAPEPVKVTPELVMASLSTSLGSNASLISSASFETLAEEPTIIIQVSKKYHVMPEKDQKKVAKTMLETARILGYDRVSLIEVGTDVEVAHAGVDIDLEDETETLRSQLAATKEIYDKIAVQNADNEAEAESLKKRLSEEREKLSAQRVQFDGSMKSLREENTGLLEDLADMNAQLAEVPDRLQLEERTVEAEQKSGKLSDTVEMLSIQVSKARGDEALAKEVEAKSSEAATSAIKEKDSALASVEGRIKGAQELAQKRLDERVASIKSESDQSIEKANSRAAEAEARQMREQEEARIAKEEMRKSNENLLTETKEAGEKEVQGIRSKYEAMLEEVKKRAQADLDAFQKEADRQNTVVKKEAKSMTNSITAERDEAMKQAKQVDMRAQKAATKAENEAAKLRERVKKLEERLKDSGTVRQAETAASSVASD